MRRRASSYGQTLNTGLMHRAVFSEIQLCTLESTCRVLRRDRNVRVPAGLADRDAVLRLRPDSLPPLLAGSSGGEQSLLRAGAGRLLRVHVAAQSGVPVRCSDVGNRARPSRGLAGRGGVSTAPSTVPENRWGTADHRTGGRDLLSGSRPPGHRAATQGPAPRGRAWPSHGCGWLRGVRWDAVGFNCAAFKLLLCFPLRVLSPYYFCFAGLKDTLY